MGEVIMKAILYVISIIFTLSLVSCEQPIQPEEDENLNQLFKKGPHATGTVEVMRLNNNGNQTNDKIMIADFNAHEEHNGQPAHGTFLFSVLNSDDLSLHRLITIDIDWVLVDESTNETICAGMIV